MSLFQESIVRKHLGYLDQEVIEQAYIRFKQVYSANKIANIKIAKEEQYQEGFIKDIFGTVLGYSVFPEQPFNIQTEKKNVADSKKADGAIFQGEDVVGVIELKDNKTKNLDAVKDQAFGYKNNHKECSYVISSNFHKLRFYIDDATEYEEFDLYNLDKETFKRFYLYLRKEGLLDKNIPKLLRQETKFHEENITKSLYKDYSSFKNTFFQNIVKNNPQIDKLILFKKSQKFLDKVLFVLFAEDKGLVTTNSIVQIIEKWHDLKNDVFDTPKPLYHLVSLFFNNLFVGKKDQNGLVLVPEFGGEIFAPDVILDTLIVDDDILKDDLLKLSRYDFNTDVDVNILGHIFEHSLNEIEEVEAELKGIVADKTIGKRKKDGIFYTPKYITKYIVENTIGKLCSEKKAELKLDIDIAIFEHQKPDGKLNAIGIVLYETLNKYKAWLLNLKILDPACGSGAFLNQAVNTLVQEHQFVDDIIAELTNTPLRLFDTDLAILENNIYGVDINEESIEIAKLSLWLRTAKQGRKLSNLSNNIKCGNSLIDDTGVDANKAFNWQKEFPEVFVNGGFDVVLGNPPYVDNRGFDKKELAFLYEKYPNSFKKSGTDKYKTTKLNLIAPFIELNLSVLKNNGLASFIFHKNIFKTNSYTSIREFILNEFKILLLTDWGAGQFQDVIAETATFVLKKERLLNEQIKVEFFHLNEKYLENYQSQSSFLSAYEFIFGIYANSIDRQILEKIESNSLELQGFVNVNNGIVTGNDSKYLSFQKLSEFSKKAVRGKDLKRYSSLKENEYIQYIKDELLRSRDENIFLSAEKLLMQMINIEFIITYDNQQFYNLGTTYAITNKDSEKIDLKFLLSILNSRLIRYYYLKKFTNESSLTNAISTQNLFKIPIKEIQISEQQPFISIAEMMLLFNKELQEESLKFQRTLERKFKLTDLARKLQDWYLLSYGDFIKELGKRKIKLSLSDEAEWEIYFSAEAKKVLELKKQIEITDKEIDQMVYQLYKLTELEIKIVEKN